MAGTKCAIGVDLGGTHLRWAVVDEHGERRYQERTERPASFEEIVRAIREGMDACLAHAGRACGAGIAVPGLIGREGVTSNNLGWHNAPLREALSSLPVPLHVLNDMAAGAVGELHFGRARGMRNVIFLTVSTGIGAGIILGGQVYGGANGLAGEVGHTVIDLNGLLCGCGRRGCWEMIASGTAHQRRIHEAYASGTWPNREREPTPAEVTESARLGDRAARALVLRTARYIGLGVVNLANVYDPDAVIFTGGFARANWDIMNAYLENEVREQAFSPNLPLLLTELGDDAGLIGAAAIALAEHA